MSAAAGAGLRSPALGSRAAGRRSAATIKRGTRLEDRVAERLNAERDAGKDRDTGEYRHVPEPPDSGSLKVAPS